jgi:hypothetical protein
LAVTPGLADLTLRRAQMVAATTRIGAAIMVRIEDRKCAAVEDSGILDEQDFSRRRANDVESSYVRHVEKS